MIPADIAGAVILGVPARSIVPAPVLVPVFAR
jgi:hypothetical protein